MTNHTEDTASRRKRDRISQSNDPPSFPFYWRDWLASLSVRAMTKEQRGGYMDYLSYAYSAKKQPGVQSADTVRAMAGFTEDEWPQHKEAFQRCFHVRADGMWVQRRVVAERAAQKRRYKRAVNAGKEGARKRASASELPRVAGPQAGPEVQPYPFPDPCPDPEKRKQVVPSPSVIARAGTPEAGTAGSQAISELLQSVLGSTRMPGATP